MVAVSHRPLPVSPPDARRRPIPRGRGWQDGDARARPGPNRHRRAMEHAMKDAMMAEAISITGHGGDQVEAYLARPVGDVAGAVAYLRAMPASNGKAGTIGYCSGGRQSFLAACSLPLDAAVDCYGAFVIGAPPEGMPLKVGPIIHLAQNLSCPLLGLFGADDSYPSPDEVAEL